MVDCIAERVVAEEGLVFDSILGLEDLLVVDHVAVLAVDMAGTRSVVD